uniref:Anaphase-promoting complex subunit 4 WD40 domain-containing protein n=2 Tax=Octopus bimaculoides TaxID=37653 RepID=A0A0L8I442_OCTBM
MLVCHSSVCLLSRKPTMKDLFSIPKEQTGNGPIQFCWQRVNGNYLVIAGVDQVVRIYDRHGVLKNSINLQGQCTGMDWDHDGDVLAIICDKVSTVYLWMSHSNEIRNIDSGMKDPLTFLGWSKKGQLLAIGTTKGNLLLYNHHTSKKLPILGKHSKKITSGAWSSENLLALVSEDKYLTISNSEGDTLRQSQLGGEPTAIQFSEMKTDERSAMTEDTVSIVISQRYLLLYNINNPDNPIELRFNKSYGSIMAYCWHGDGYIVIGFSSGYFVGISTHIKEIGQELFSTHDHKEGLTNLALSPYLNKIATSGGSSIRIHEMNDSQEIYAIIQLEEDYTVDKMMWTEDGQLMAVSSLYGHLQVFLTKLPMLAVTYQTRIANLTSLLEVTVQDNINNDSPLAISIDIEPSFIALGPSHLAVGMNNIAWFYHLEKGDKKLREVDYVGSVQSLKMNAIYVAAHIGDKIHLHILDADNCENEEFKQKQSRLFEGNKSHITHHAMTEDFLIFCTSSGLLQYFYMDDWKFVNEYKHTCGILKVFPHSMGNLIFIDDKFDGFVYNPANDQVVDVPKLDANVQGVLWETDPRHKGLFITFTESQISVYVYAKNTLHGSICEFVYQCKTPFCQIPVLLNNGQITLLNQSGRLVTMILSCFSLVMKTDLSEISKTKLQESLALCIKLRRWKDCLRLCEALGTKNNWEVVAEAALRNLEIDEAIAIYRQIKCPAMVRDLKEIGKTEEWNLLIGYVAMILKEFNLAQESFLSSSQPKEALEMRKDLLQWDSALQLAKVLDPESIPFISLESAEELELTGKYMEALNHYEQGITNQKEDEHNKTCAGGTARMAIRTGDIRRGVKIASKISNRTLHKDCAEILESMKQWAESAALYEKGGFYDKAASSYIKCKNWNKVGELLHNVTSSKIHIQYAKAKEVDGHYKEAVEAYRLAKDWDNVIRIYLEFLQNPEAAAQIVKETKSVEGAKMVSQFFQKLDDFNTAIEFLVVSGCNDEAFQIAQMHDAMEIYARIIGNDASPEIYHNVAVYFAGEQNHLWAGKFFLLSQHYDQALRHLLMCKGEDREAIDLAIKTVKEANDIELTKQLSNYLLGDTDGLPKDAKYLFRLHMALSQYKEAASIAIIISKEEQNSGNYRHAHDVLFAMYQELKENKMKIPAEMSTNLMILHSYLLVKMCIKLKETVRAARLLVRVANNISKFPSHIIPILTTTVIQCHRAGLRNSSFSYAAMLLRDEYQRDIDPKLKKKIEGIVRKRDKSEEDELLTPCPFCQSSIPETLLVCPDCKMNIPYCIATGCHITKENLTACPKCQFPALYSEYIKLLESEEKCPMCSETILRNELTTVTDPKMFLPTSQGIE